MIVNLSIDQYERVFTEAIAAEAVASGKEFDTVAKEWALTYADAALSIFAQYRPNNQNAPALLRASRARLRTAGLKVLQEYERARSRFRNRPGCGQRAAPRRAMMAILDATRAVNDAFPLYCLMDAAAALREAEVYARQRPAPFAKGLPPCPL